MNNKPGEHSIDVTWQTNHAGESFAIGSFSVELGKEKNIFAFLLPISQCYDIG